MKTAVMEGAVTGGGLTVIANAPNPAGQAIWAGISTARCCRSGCWPALLPTLLAVIAFRILP
jgi:hypothetical protein